MLDITEEKAKAIFKYIASNLRCNDVKITNYIEDLNSIYNVLMARDIETHKWFSLFLIDHNRRGYFIDGTNYISMLDKIIKYKYIALSGRKYKIPNSLEELFIEMDLKKKKKKK